MSRAIVARANSLAAIAIIALMSMVGLLTWQGFASSQQARAWAREAQAGLMAVQDFGIAIRDAETGQRGFLLTRDPNYLAPYADATARVPGLYVRLQQLLADDPVQQAKLQALAAPLQDKLSELAETIRLTQAGNLAGALALVRTNAGAEHMAQIEAIMQAVTTEQIRIRESRIAASMEDERRNRWMAIGSAGVALLLLLLAARWLAVARAETVAAQADQMLLTTRLRTSLDSLSQGVGVFDAEQRLINWNSCFEVLLRLPSAMLREGTPYAAFAEHTAAEAGTAILESADQVRHTLTGRSPNEPVVYERDHGPEGHVLEIRRTPMPSGGFVVTISDMTQRSRTEAVLRDAQKMQAVGQLTGGIAHDFNNLLTVIIGNLESVAKKIGEGVLQERIGRAMWAAQRGATLTRHMLAFARKQPLEPKPLDFANVLPEMVGLLRRTLGEQIDVRVVESAGLWPAMADPAQLESAVLNLALNARDAMPNGGRLTIEIANRVIDEDYASRHAEVVAGDYAMLAVSDTGFGMTADVIKRVFEPFFTTKPVGKGTGLGLAMVYGFVKQSNGHVKIYSEPGEGTSVKLYLPRATAAAGPQRSVAPVELPRGDGLVLVVEDDPDVREIAVGILRELGYRVLEAGDGDEALRVFGANGARIDMLLVDVVLPGTLRGSQIAERITAIQPGVKVLFMSGYTENSIVHHGRLDDGVQLIGKPFSRDQLARKVADVIGVAEPVQDGGNIVPMAKRVGRE